MGDVAKGAAILLMVVGHELNQYVYPLIFSVHMPLFFILSGYTSRLVEDVDILNILDDYFKYDKENQQAVYDFTLQQVKMNTMRINTLHDEKANFVISIEILQQYFPTFESKRKELMYLEKSLRQGNYRKFQIANLGM